MEIVLNVIPVKIYLIKLAVVQDKFQTFLEFVLKEQLINAQNMMKA